MYILGIGDVIHDVSVCLMRDTEILVAIEEERLNRIRYGIHFTDEDYTIAEHGKKLSDIVSKLTVAVREKKLLPLIEYCLSSHNLDFENISHIVTSTLFKVPAFRHQAVVINHHVAHAASAFFPSPFSDAAILAIDGDGNLAEDEWVETALFAVGENTHLQPLHSVSGKAVLTTQEKGAGIKPSLLTLDNSLGAFYKNVTVLLGLGDMHEGKTMALAAYGRENKHLSGLRNFVHLLPDGQFTIENRAIFEYVSHSLVRAKSSLDPSSLFQFKADVAYQLQQLTEKVLIHCCHYLYQKTRKKQLCLAGGVTLNCVANRKILDATPFENIFIQPAAGDNGIAIGCAFYGAHMLQGIKRHPSATIHFSPYLGKSYREDKINEAIEKYDSRLVERSTTNIYQATARFIAEGKLVGWYQERSELGPRALGNRSILADPRKMLIKEILNQRIKNRERFRPFAPAVLEQFADVYFDLDIPSPYMLLVAKVKVPYVAQLPAVTHVDQSARVQTVHQSLNPVFYELISAFYRLTGLPILLNTSFNGKDEPIVETPLEAIKCFLNIGLDVLVIGSRLFEKVPINITVGVSDFAQVESV